MKAKDIVLSDDSIPPVAFALSTSLTSVGVELNSASSSFPTFIGVDRKVPRLLRRYFSTRHIAIFCIAFSFLASLIRAWTVESLVNLPFNILNYSMQSYLALAVGRFSLPFNIGFAWGIKWPHYWQARMNDVWKSRESSFRSFFHLRTRTLQSWVPTHNGSWWARRDNETKKFLLCLQAIWEYSSGLWIVSGHSGGRCQLLVRKGISKGIDAVVPAKIWPKQVLSLSHSHPFF